MLRLSYVLVIFTVFLSVNCCYLDSDKWARCSTFDELWKEGPQTWFSLYMTGNGKENYVPVNKQSFNNTLDVVNILASRILNDIEPKTFEDQKKLYWLKLTENKIHTLRSGCFDNENLQILTIQNCDVWDIEPGIFKNVPKLKEARIQDNKIPYLKPKTFENSNLLVLGLRDNNIQYIEPGAFDDLPSLTGLLLHGNRLTTVSRDLFTGAPKVEALLLHLNLIESIEDHAFVDLKNLASIDLSNNRLEEIPANLFPSTNNKLYWFFIQNNLLTYLAPDLLNRLTSLKKVSMAGNPWQCQCLNNMQKYFNEKNIDSICDQQIRRGDRPKCVSPEGNSMCTYDSKYRTELIKYYQKIIREYPQLPPICQTRDITEPKLEPVNN